MGFFKRKKKDQQPKKAKVNKEKPLPSLSEEEFEQWVEKGLQLLNLEKGEYSFAPFFDGILVYVRRQGIIWIPKKAMIKGSGFEIVGKALTSATPFAVGFATGGPIGALIAGFGSYFLKGTITEYALLPPPSKITQYLQASIKQVELIPFEYYSGYLKKIKKASLRKDKEKDPYIQEEGALRIVSVFDIPKSGQNQKQETDGEEQEQEKQKQKQKQKVKKPRLQLFRYPIYQDIKPFLDSLEENGIPVKLGKM